MAPRYVVFFGCWGIKRWTISVAALQFELLNLHQISLSMRFALLFWALSLTSRYACASPDAQSLQARQDSETRTDSIFIDPAEQPKLPTADQAQSASRLVGLNLDNIQGDILVGMKKKKELFFFFSIRDSKAFKSKIKRVHPLITTTKQLLSVRTQPITAVNLAFTQSGLNALGVTDDLADGAFKAGQFADAENLGDPGTGKWIPAFKGTSIHGVFILASDSLLRVNTQLLRIQAIMGSSIHESYRLQGSARPGNQEGHEHFGYMDGISQPAIAGFTVDPLPGQITLDPGQFILGERGDATNRPAWAKDGSFLAFRQLQQFVPEFDQFVIDNALKVPGLTKQENIDLFGARMVGRWKSGAPIDLAPLRDDQVLAKDARRNNDFNFNHGDGFDIVTNQTNCPFSAHIRKTRPRADFGEENTSIHIIRAGIPYGPEVTLLEKQLKKSSDLGILERGLAFVAYQSNIGSGFQFIQKNWVDNANFFFGKQVPPGVDPIIGSTNQGPSNGNTPRPVSGLDPLDPSRIITIKKDFVVSRGGEYFFSPSLSAILDPIAK
ncbi:dyp-type peroxidase family protein [Moniliophthora roreri MCA 2997]|uniref:Dyp-type peroxidase family protein n=1 Tax=Moniliophthora roreri (strain MCA 2997) TaxID=1381753 RepID=V2XVP7_MONRO|nr:dyp-type peroxidase family protein [Moniliophthora roreri MCA 2997]